jgi:TolB-like protein/Flp pilus assembly protein TadD
LSGTAQAVFISYASQDAEAASRICQSLRAAGIEVWFDQSELRGGEAWDLSIRKQIKTCALFLPVISRNTHDRVEGYFRLEWKLGVDRSHLISADQAFLLPVVIDDTRDDDERVPERFREVQWTHLPGGVTPAGFVERVRRLLSGEPSQGPTRTASGATCVSPAATTGEPVFASWRWKAALLATIAVLVAALGYLVVNRVVLSKRGAEVGAAPAPAAQSAPATAFNPPPHSVAVLPFVNMSGDKEQEYFSDGLTEELLNSLSRVSELQVAGRTSSFYFKGEHTDLSSIAHKLNVGTVLEGSVRRSAHTVRITAQLINAGTGFHLWSQTYDRPFGDILKLQTEIANAVAGALKVSLLGDVTATSDLGGTQNPAAFDAYLRAMTAYRNVRSVNDLQAAISAYDQVLRLDPNYAHAYADRALLHWYAAYEFASAKSDVHASLHRAIADANRAIALAPAMAEGHVALAEIFETELNFKGANEAFERSIALAPGGARVLGLYSGFAVAMGHTEKGLAAGRQALTLDPLNVSNHHNLGYDLMWARRYAEALGKFNTALSISPGDGVAKMLRGYTYYMLGEFEKARVDCEATADIPFAYACLALVYQKLGQHSGAADSLAKHKGSMGDAGAYASARILAEWGDRAGALEWLETAFRLRDHYLEYLKIDPVLDPLRKEPRFQAIERALKFPPD